MCFSLENQIDDNSGITFQNKVCQKWSAKGVVKKLNSFTPNDFFIVLKTKQSQTVTNTNFKLINTKMHNCSTTKIGIGHLYLKREVFNDGISTLPLYI